MSSRIARLMESYQRHIELPWQPGLAGVQKVIFVWRYVLSRMSFQESE